MTVGIMQPYFLPYLGYWQLLAAVDQFVIYDNIQYTKKGWINRNRFLRHGTEAFFTLPLQKASDYLNVADRVIADDFNPADMLNAWASAYRKAPSFPEVFPVLERIVTAAPRNLFEYLQHSLAVTAEYLDIRTPMIVSSSIAVDHSLRSEQKVIALCTALGADRYVNFVGGRELYSTEMFATAGLDLKFIQARPIVYPQFTEPFVPALSIVDVMMFNSMDAVRGMVSAYDLVS